MKTIIVAEDDTLLSTILVKNFQNAGFDALAAHDGVMAIDMVKSKHPDLLLLDILMPGKDGFEVLEDIRNDPQYKELPVIVLTNFDSEEYIARAKSYHVVDCLLKIHSTPKSIVERVDQVLGE